MRCSVIDDRADEAALAEVKLVSFGMDVAKAEHHELPSGEPYVLIPTETVMDAGDGKTVARSHTLALLDDGRLVPAARQRSPASDDPASSLSRFADVEFPRLIGGVDGVT